MRRSRSWLILAVAASVLIVGIGSSLIWSPNGLLHHQSGLAKTSALSRVTQPPTPAVKPPTVSTPSIPTTSPTGAPPPTPLPAPDAVAAMVTPTPPASEPAATHALEHGMVTESNGMSLGCDPGLVGHYLTCRAREPEGFSMTFYLFVPTYYNVDKTYALVLVMQGGGERAVAKNPAWLNRVGVVANPYAEEFGPGYPGPYSINVQGRWPSFIVIPQLVNPARFVDVPANQGSYTLAPQPNDSMRMTKEIVDTLQLAYTNIDANRLYLTGLSMGGYGAWEAAERWPSYWAAVAPIAGAGDPSKASLLVNIPIWAFHSADDPVVPVSGSRDMIQAIRAAGGHPRYTEYMHMGHGEWLAPYTIMGRPSPTIDFFSWLFAQHK